MSFLARFSADRAAKRAAAQLARELASWKSEKDLLSRALQIFTDASQGKEPDDQSLVQKKGEYVIWTGSAIFHEAGRTAARYSGGSTGFSVPVGAGIRVRVGSHSGTITPGASMQIDKDQGFVKLTNQRLIFAGSLETSEWAFAKMLSVAKTEDGNDFLISVSNRKKTSGLRFSPSDAAFFARIFAMALYAYENGIPTTIKSIESELKALESEKPSKVDS